MKTKHLIKSSIHTLIILGACLVTFLKTNPVVAQQIDANFISVSDGLASTSVQGIIQDNYGYLWFCTANGLQKYDGFTFETYKNIPGKANSLQNNIVLAIAEDDAHNLWIGTSAGVSKLDRIKKTFKNYDFTKIFNLLPNRSGVMTIFIDSQKNIWAGTREVDLARYDKVNDTWIRASYAIPNKVGEANVISGSTWAIIEDSKGVLWTGSDVYGLLYRAKNEETFKPVVFEQPQAVDFTSSEHIITALFSDQENKLWITTRNGIFKYNPENKSLKTLQIYLVKNTNVWDFYNCIMQDSDGNIWIANNDRGILKFNGISDQFQTIPFGDLYKQKGFGNSDAFIQFIIDKSDIFWIGSIYNGVLKYDPAQKPFAHYIHDAANKKSISMNSIYGLLASKIHPHIIYVGMRGAGLNIFDEDDQSFKQVKYNAVNDFFGGSVRCIGEKSDGTIYLGTLGDGLIELDKNFKEIRRFVYNKNAENSISDNNVRVLKKDAKNNFWVGTKNGLNYFDTKANTFKRFSSTFTKIYPQGLVKKIETWSQSKKIIAKIVEVTDNQNLTQAFEITKQGTYLIASVGEANIESMTMVDFGFLLNASKDTIWISNQLEKTNYAGGAIKNRIQIERIKLEPGKYELRYHSDESHSYGAWNDLPPDKTSFYGIVLVDLSESSDNDKIETLLKLKTDQVSLSSSNILSIQLTDNYLWVGTDAGLNRIDLKTNKIKVYRANANMDNSLSNDNISDIAEDKKGILWIATYAGLNKLDPKTDTLTQYYETDGLPTNFLTSVVIGKNDEVWIATVNGLSQMVTNETLGKVTFINYNSADGLGGDVFMVATVTPEGRFYFGGEHGLNAVSKIMPNNVPPSLVLSNLLISNQSVYDMGDASPVKKDLMSTEVISLAFNQNNLSFEFAALHFANPKKNQYAHILKGYDKDWVYDNRNYASYTNLDPGTYEFIFRASNAYGVWNEKGKSIKIIISPPWYKTWWAYAAYAIFFGILIFIFDHFMRKRLILKEREKSREKELAQAKEIEKAYTELKTTQSQLIQAEKMASLGELTAGIAHEIQNPLNFVNNFSEVNKELIEEMKAEIEKGNFEEVKALVVDIESNEEKINHHGKRADAIVKGMLQHSRSSSGQKEPTDINALADEYLRLSYHGLRAKDKSFNATMKTDFDDTIGKINIIPQDIGRVILNLLTNAFYAVTEKKKLNIDGYEPVVTISTKEIAGKIEIKVSDNGNGIPQKILDKIFQPFFTTKPTGQGTGLGLSISYDIITKGHGGELTIETRDSHADEFSEKDEGSCFTIRLPIN